MNFYGDYHTHSVYSDGTAKISDAVAYAKQIGLKELAITDHGFANVTLSLTEKKFAKAIKDVENVRKSIDGINVLLGVEADIIDTKGTLDVTDKHLMNMDILVAGFHRFIRSTSAKDYFGYVLFNGFVTDIFGTNAKKKAEATDAFISAIENYPVDILSHVGNHAVVDVKEVCKTAERCGTLIEINMKHLSLVEKQLPEMLDTNCKFIVDSDAHKLKAIGDFERAEEIIKKYDIPRSRVVNLGAKPVFTRLNEWKKKYNKNGKTQL